MIKFVGEGPDNIRLIGLCLSRKNCEKLLAGEPIGVDLRKDLNLPYRARIGIFGGETERAIYEQFKRDGRLDEETVARIDESLKAQAKPEEAAKPSRTLDVDVRLWLERLEAAGLLTFEDFPEEGKASVVPNADYLKRMTALPLDALLFFNDMIERNHPDHPSRQESGAEPATATRRACSDDPKGSEVL